MFDVTFGGAFVAGLLSFLSPCILPMVPFYLSYLAGVSVNQVTGGEGVTRAVRLRAILAATLFAAGILTVFTVFGIIVMPALVTMMVSGYIGTERFDLAVYYGRIAFPYILFMSLAALFSGVLNATGRFAAAAAAPVLLNIFACAAMTAGALMGGDVVLWLVWTIPVAGVAQLALVWAAAARAGITLRPGLPQLHHTF